MLFQEANNLATLASKETSSSIQTADIDALLGRDLLATKL
jgi:hypothetical protein